MNDRFDAWTKSLVQHDRRGLLQTAAVGALGLLGFTAVRDGVLAKQCNNNKDCPKGNPRCRGGKCVQCAKNSDCNKNQKCKHNKCRKK